MRPDSFLNGKHRLATFERTIPTDHPRKTAALAMSSVSPFIRRGPFACPGRFEGGFLIVNLGQF